MGCYGIGVGRNLATVVENSADKDGMNWPTAIAPFQVHLINLNKDSVQADKVYTTLQKQGIEVLYDDRDEAAGMKFKDADLIGIPVRLVVSAKTKELVEYKERNQNKAQVINLEEVIKKIN